MRYFAKVILVVLLTQLIGCATQTFKSNVSIEKRKTISIVYAQGGSGASGVLSGILLPIGTKKSVHFVNVDGKKITAQKNSKNKEFWLEPGIHEIEVKCTIQLDATYFDGKQSFEYNFIAGKEYLLDAVIPDRLSNVCNPKILMR